jgi:hypothetical protein
VESALQAKRWRDTAGVTSRARPAVTVVVALATVGLLAVLPTGRSESCSSDRFNQSVCSSQSRTIPEENGRGVLVVLSIPAAVATAGVIRPSRRVLVGVAIVLTLLLVPAMLSVGVFFVPTAIAAWLVFGDADRRQAPAPASSPKKASSTS